MREPLDPHSDHSVATGEPKARETPRGISRRTVVKAAAWSAPVVALAVGTPLAAASTTPDGLTIRFTQPIYDIEPSTAVSDVVAQVQSTAGGATTPVSGADITFTLSQVPAGTVLPGPSGGSVPTGPNGAGQPPAATLPNGGQTATLGQTDGSGMYALAPVTTGTGWGLLKLTATTTVNGVTATTETYLRIAIRGPIFSFGYPGYGQLGNGNTGFQPTPSYVNYSDFNAVEIVGRWAQGAALLTSGGDIYAWGYGGFGLNAQGGTDQTSLYVPAPIVTAYPGQTFTSLSGGYYVMGAVDSNGGAYAWGQNVYGVITADTSNLNGAFYTPRLIHPSLETGVVKLEVATMNGYALKGDGTVWAWGYNWTGSMGTTELAPGAYSTQPVQVVFPDDVQIVDIAAGWAAGYAVDVNGDLWAWGSGDGYRLGNGDTAQRLTPTKFNAPGDRYVSVSSGPISYSAAGIKDDGTGMYWGWNAYGNSGNGSAGGYVTTPQPIGLSGVAQIEPGYFGTYVRLANGDVYYAGYNGSGEAGVGNYTAYLTSFTKTVGLDGPARDIAHTYGTGFVLTTNTA